MATLHRSVVTLRIRGNALIPNEISALLGAQPTEAKTMGDQTIGASTGRVYIARSGMWRLDATTQEPADLDQQVQEVLGRLTQDLSVWLKIRSEFAIDLFCGFFLEEGNEGLSVSAQTLVALGQRGIELGLDIYGPTED